MISCTFCNGHWDGFKPFRSTEQHSCGQWKDTCIQSYFVKVCLPHTVGSIEVSIATMGKADRSKTDEVYVVGFIPCHLLHTSTHTTIYTLRNEQKLKFHYNVSEKTYCQGLGKSTAGKIMRKERASATRRTFGQTRCLSWLNRQHF